MLASEQKATDTPYPGLPHNEAHLLPLATPRSFKVFMWTGPHSPRLALELISPGVDG